jgi:phosphate transport system substrate-binding protein
MARHRRVADSRTKSAVPAALILLGTLAAAAMTEAPAQSARDYVSIVGSSTVYPFSTVVAERFGRDSEFRTPKVESTGTGGGFKLFCGGIGVEHPDITNASRPIKQSEVDECASHGVSAIVEVMIGYDGIVLANSRESPHIDLTLEQVFLALAKNVPDPAAPARLIPNPYRRWSDIAPDLPETPIEVLGPPPTSGTRDAFLELAMQVGCASYPAIAALEGDAETMACHTIREDGPWIDAGENDNLIVQKLEANPSAFGIFGFSFLEQNSDKVQPAWINGVEPTFDNIAAKSYSISRALYFYVKAQHANVIPGIREFLAEFTSDAALGEFGYLSERGLIPLRPEERRASAAGATSLTPVRLGD